jgi:hypothetical protein
MSDVNGPGSVFGGGLDSQSGAPAYNGDGSGALPAGGLDAPIAQAPVQPQTPAPQGSAPPKSSFGSAFISPIPHYDSPDPQATALDQASSLLQQRIQRAGKIAASPLAAFFSPESVAAAREAVPKMTEQLQQIQTQKAAVQAGRAQAQTLGLTPGEAPDQATAEDRLDVASAKALKGDTRAFQGISAIASDKAAALAPQYYAAIGGHLNNAQTAFDSLSGMENEGQYQAKIKQLRQDGTLTDLESAGLKLPPTFDAFKAAAPAEALALRNARAAINSQGQALEQRNTYVPMESKEQDTYKGALKTVYGDELNLGPWSRNGASGTRGQLANGIATVDDFGKTGGGATAEQRKQIGDEFKTAAPPADIEKYRGFNRIYQLATTDAKGNALPADKINTNPNVQQGIAEGLASMLRGGRASANVGLLNIETAKRGVMQAMFDKIQSGYAGTLNTLSGDDVRPYLTGVTQDQIRQVMDGLKQWNDSSIGDRATGIARRAGALGMDASALGLGQDEANGVINNAIEEGRRAQVERMRPYFQPIGAGNGVLQLGAQRPGAGSIGLPPGAQTSNQLPNAQPLLTPVQQAGNNPPVGPPAQQPVPPLSQPPSLSPGGGTGQTPSNPQAPAPQPVMIAGQQVNVALPPGASPAYVASLQRIETGNERNPWTAGAQNTSAGGAFQAVKATWDQFKPPGAPDRAKDATPQQQADFLSRLTTANATALQTAGIPVNDTNLYVAHNLGAAGAASLLKANPDADARTVVGETAAKNNPLFFKGRPTVATVLGRYQANVAQDVSDSVPRRGASDQPDTAPVNLTPLQRESLARRGVETAAPGPTPEQQEQVRQGVPGQIGDLAPAALSTVGALAGSLGGPPGAIAGGAAGGGVGAVVKNYLKGKPQSPTEIAEQTALGGALGVASEARPILAAVARVGGSAAIEAGTEAAQGGNAADVADAGLRGGGYALGGEALGRFVSMGGAAAYKALSRYTTTAQSELSSQAGKLAAARDVLKTEEPKLATGDANPKFDAAKQSEEDAITAIKDHGQNPDDMVHAYEQAKSGVSAGEAAVMRKAASEKNAASQGYDQLRQDVRDAGVGTPKANQSLPDGPVAQLRTAENPTGTVEAKFAPDAQHAEMLIKAPAKDWGDKWQQLQDAGSELIQKRMAFLQNGDRPSADAMDSIFEGVRNQQKAAAEYVFGPQKGGQVIDRLEDLDQRYAKVMNATQGMDYSKMRSVVQAGNTPERRALEKNFTAFAGDDPSAMRAFNAMKAGARGRLTDEAKLMVPIITAESLAHLGGVPTVGAISAVVGGHRLYKVMQEYANAKLLGNPVKFSDFLNRDIQSNNPAGQVVRGAVQRGAVQGVGASP